VLTEISDGGSKGLRLACHPSGHKSWIVRFRFGGKSRKLTLGDAVALDKGAPNPKEVLTLFVARTRAAEAQQKIDQGIDPGVEKLAQQRPINVETFRSIAEGCFTREAKRLRTAQRLLNDLRRLVFPTLGDQAITSIKRSDIVRLLDGIEAESGPVAADSMLSAISKAMHDHSRRSDDYVPPLVRGMRRTKTKERARDRVLTDPELIAVWNAAGDAGLFGSLVRFLLLTGCRRNEASHMPWSELSNGNGKLWVLPKERNKTKQELIRPLSQAAQALLDQIPRDSDLVFSACGHHLFNNINKHKRNFDKASGVTGWVIHDIRRTARSLMSRGGVNADIAERALGHIIPGVRGTYDRHQYQAEMLHAYEALAALIQNITSPEPDAKVVALRG